jgi:hypothetical protein
VVFGAARGGLLVVVVVGLIIQPQFNKTAGGNNLHFARDLMVADWSKNLFLNLSVNGAAA